jgi:hypothetical protein
MTEKTHLRHTQLPQKSSSWSPGLNIENETTKKKKNGTIVGMGLIKACMEISQ